MARVFAGREVGVVVVLRRRLVDLRGKVLIEVVCSIVVVYMCDVATAAT